MSVAAYYLMMLPARLLAAALTLGIPMNVPRPPATAAPMPGGAAVAPSYDGFVAAWCFPDCKIATFTTNGSPEWQQAQINLLFGKTGEFRLAPPAIAPNGGLALFATTGGTFAAMARSVGQQFPSAIESLQTSLRPAIAFDRLQYGVVVAGDTALTAMFLSTTGKPISPPIPVADGVYSSVAIASNDHGSLIVATSLTGVDFFRLSSSGSVTPLRTIASPQPSNARVVWDGSGYLVGWSAAGSAWGALAEADGSLRRPVFPLGDGALATITAVPGGAAVMLDPPRVIRDTAGVLSAPQEFDAGVPRVGEAAFKDGRFFVTAQGELSGATTDLQTRTGSFILGPNFVTQNNPVVASGDAILFVAWQEVTYPPLQQDIRVSRVNSFGVPMDAQAVGSGMTTAFLDATPYVAAIATGDGDRVELRHLDISGRMTQPITISKKGRAYGVASLGSDTAVVWGANRKFFATYASGKTFALPFIPLTIPVVKSDGGDVLIAYWAANDDYAVTRLHPDGTHETFTFANLSTVHLTPAIATDHDSRIAITVKNAVAVLTEATGDMKRYDFSYGATDADIAWDGKQFVVSNVGGLWPLVDGKGLTNEISTPSGTANSPRVTRLGIAFDGVTVQRFTP